MTLTLASTVHSSGLDFEEGILWAAVITLAMSLFRWWRKRRNTPQYQRLAERYGGTYAPKAEARAVRFPESDWGLDIDAYEVHDYLTGSHEGRRFYCCGWRYSITGAIGGGDSGRNHVDRTVYAMELPGDYGSFSVRKHSRARAIFGQNDVQIGHPGFDERFTVHARDPEVAQRVLTGELVEFLLNDERSKDYPLWFLGDRLVCSYQSRFGPDDVEPALEYMAHVVARLASPASDRAREAPLSEDIVPVAG
ncbi:hypothetical protein [Streptomyces sp. TR06-5]|uniref:hypothetical protein n=1 Tax=Streptomyces sp. TR06-5 TaxID=3385976 RepID=UPI0039A3B6DB